MLLTPVGRQAERVACVSPGGPHARQRLRQAPAAGNNLNVQAARLSPA